HHCLRPQPPPRRGSARPRLAAPPRLRRRAERCRLRRRPLDRRVGTNRARHGPVGVPIRGAHLTRLGPCVSSPQVFRSTQRSLSRGGLAMFRAAFRCLAAVFVVAFAAAPPARAPARLAGADLVGRVMDESAAVLPGANLTVVNRDTNLTRTAVGDARGEFKVPALPPGTYKVTAQAQGFASQTRDGVTLQLGQTAEIEFLLKLSGTMEELTIVSESPMVDVTDTSVSSVVGQQQIENLPINFRNFLGFSVITPGVTTDRTPQQGASATSGLSFTGQRARSNNIM